MRVNLIWPAIIYLLTLVACSTETSNAPQAAGPMPFAVLQVAKQSVTVNQEYIANLQGQQNVEIRPKVSGFIQKIYIDEGEEVKKGQLLFKLETQTLNEDAEAAKAQIQSAQVEVDRLIPLVERKIISQVQLDAAKAQLSQAKSNYSAITANIGYANITSPVSGVVGGLPYKEGSLVSASDAEPLTIVSDIKNVRAYFSINEKQLLHFSKKYKGVTLDAMVDSMPEVSLKMVDNSLYDHKGKIQTINGLINERTGTIDCRAVFPNPDRMLRSGGSGTILLPITQNNIFLIPQVAVFELQGKKLVYVVGDDNKVNTKVIETNGTSDKDFIVTGGLKEGDKLVVEGVSKLQDGQEIIPDTSTSKANLSFVE